MKQGLDQYQWETWNNLIIQANPMQQNYMLKQLQEIIDTRKLNQELKEETK